MPLSVNCPNCGASYLLNDSLAGKKVRCKKCQDIFAVGPAGEGIPAGARIQGTPVPPQIPTMPLARLQQPSFPSDPAAYRPARERPAPSGISGLIIGLIVGGGVLLIAVVVGVVLLMRSKSDKDSTAQLDPPAEKKDNLDDNRGNNPPEKRRKTPPIVAGQGDKPVDVAISPGILADIKRATVFVKVDVQGNSFSGSGFVMKGDRDTAYVVTNHHVIEPTVQIEVPERRVAPPKGPRLPINPRLPRNPIPPPASPPPGMTPRSMIVTLKNAAVTVVFDSGRNNERSLPAEVVSADPERDLAVLLVKGVKDLPNPIDFANEPQLAETMPVYTFGFPFGKALATSKGNPAITVGKAVISSLRENDDGELTVVQIDGSLNPGNSGGPVVDAQGRLVGVAVATIKNSSGIGLAIPGSELRKMLQGRLGIYHVSSRMADKGKVAVSVEVGMIDPLDKITAVTLHYLPGSQLRDAAQPISSLAALPGCLNVKLTTEKQLATGELLLSNGDKESELLLQAEYVNGSGQRVKAKVLRQTLNATQVAEVKPPVAPPPVAPPSGDVRPPSDNDLARLLADLKSGDKERRKAAANQLAKLKASGPRAEIAKALLVMLADPDIFTIKAAAGALKTWAATDDVSALAKLAGDNNIFIRQETIQLLSQLPTEEGAAALATRLTNIHDRPRAGDALRKMGSVGEKAARPYVKFGDTATKAEACKVLAAVGTAQSIPDLKMAAADPAPEVARAAKDALDAIARRGNTPPSESKPVPADTKPLPSEGKLFAPKNEMFTIVLPASGKTSERKQVLTIGQNRVAVEGSQSTVADGTSFLGASIGIPAVVMRELPAEKRFDVLRDALMKSLNGKVTAEKDIKQDPVVGKEYQIELPKGAARMQLYTIAGWVVYAIVQGPSKEQVNGKQADAFYNSLKLTDKAKDVFRQVKR